MITMRTEDDLRAVLFSEEDKAPGVDHLIAALPTARRRRRHTGLVAAAAAVAVAGVVTGAVAVAGSHRTGGIAAEGSSVSSSNAGAAAAPTEQPEQAQARLSEAVRAALRTAAPKAVPDGPFRLVHATAPEFGYYTAQLITVGSARGVLEVGVERQIGPGETCASVFGSDVCQQQAGPNGERILTNDDGGSGNRSVGVAVARDGGSVVFVRCSNATTLTLPDDGGKAIETGGYTGDAPPLTPEQVRAIALDPTVSIHP
jgi:hypothetical protein